MGLLGSGIVAGPGAVVVPSGPPPGSGLPVQLSAPSRKLAAAYTILVTDPNLTIVGDPVAGWLTLSVTRRWKEPSSAQFTVPAYPWIRDQLTPGCRIVILRRAMGVQKILIGGPMEKILRERSDGGSSDQNGGVGMLTVTLVDDMAWLGARLAYPNPALTPDTQTTDFWDYTGRPEPGLLQLVNTQAGPGALAARRVPKLVVAPDSNVPGTNPISVTDTTVPITDTTSVTARSRLEKCTDVLREMCTLGVGDPARYHPDSLGFYMQQVGTQIVFQVVRSRDLSASVHFSFGMGNLKYYSWELDAPSADVAIVGGQGSGADRFVREFVNPDASQAAWGRFEQYVPEAGSDTLAQMQAAATTAFKQGDATGRLAINAADTVDCRYGVNYQEGDLVSVELDIGEYVTAPVQTATIQAWPTAGEVVGTTIGDQAARYDSAWIRQMRTQDKRLGELERRSLVYVSTNP